VKKLIGFSVVSALALAGCAMPPSDVSEAQLALYDEAVASIGCELRFESDYLPVEFQAGLNREQAIAISQYKIALGEAESLPDGGVKLTTGACA